MRALAVLLALLLGHAAHAEGFSLRAPPGWAPDPQIAAKARAAYARLPERELADAVAYRSPKDARFVMVAQVLVYPNDSHAVAERSTQMMDALARSIEGAGMIRKSSTQHHRGNQTVDQRWYEGGGLAIRLAVHVARDARGDLHALQIICTDDGKGADCQDALASASLETASLEEPSWLADNIGVLVPAAATVVVVALAVIARRRRRGR